MNPYTKYLPETESQAYPSFDTYSCTNFSFCNLFETYLNRMIKEKTISAGALKFLNDYGYLDKNGVPNFSDQYNSILSGTTWGVGNTFEKVIESALRDGLVPDKMFTDNPKTKEEYFDPKLITDEMRKVGKEFLSFFTIKVEDKNAPISALQNDLLWLTVSVCPGYGVDQIIKTCVYSPSHAVLGYDIEGHDNGNVVSFLDTYPNYFKQTYEQNVYAKYRLSISEVNQLNNNMLTNLIREKGRQEVYAMINNKPYYIGGQAFADLLADKLVRWEDIKEVDFVINLEGIIK